MTDCDFTIEHWEETINTALELGYRFCTFSDWIGEKPADELTILLRHDVDISPEMARRLARIETGLGIKATYFIRLHSKLYQPQDSESMPYMKELAELNVEIGLHYERQIYEENGWDHIQALADDAAKLGEIIGRPVKGCAGHRVSTFPHFDTETVRAAGLSYEAYAPEFVTERKYISDSARNWREGCLCQWLGKAKHLTVLTHPVWWFEPAGMKDSILEKIRRGD